MAQSQKLTGWRNWSGDTHVPDAVIHHPQSEADLRALILSASGPVRPVGSGHSWTPLVPASTILSLDHFADVGRVDEDGCAWIGAGAPLHMISPSLAFQNYAFENLGDINVQTLAGATATATHGSGATLPCLSANIMGVKLMTSTGESIEISKNHNQAWLRAARVSLGALGVITDIYVKLVPHHMLHRKVWFAPYRTLREQAHDLWQEHRNFEFFYLPFSDYCMAISHDITDAKETPRAKDQSDDAVAQLRLIRNMTKWWPWLRRKLLSGAISRAPTENVIGESHRLLASERNTLFNEMEYHIPAAQGLNCLDEIIHRIERHHPDIYFPIEVRQTAPDDAFLSPFQGGPRISIAVHYGADDPYAALFSEIEPIFKRYRGRPHWGKLNSLQASELKALYPEYTTFDNIRRQLDPHNRFLNPYLQSIFDA